MSIKSNTKLTSDLRSYTMFINKPEKNIDTLHLQNNSQKTTVGEVWVSCAIFCFKASSRQTIVFTCVRLCQVKIYKFGYIMCNSWLHGTAVEFTVGCRKINLKWHNLPQPWGKLCHCKGQVVSICHVKKSLCKCSESKR